MLVNDHKSSPYSLSLSHTPNHKCLRMGHTNKWNNDTNQLISVEYWNTHTHTSLSRQTVDLNDGVQPKTIDLLFFLLLWIWLILGSTSKCAKSICATSVPIVSMLDRIIQLKYNIWLLTICKLIVVLVWWLCHYSIFTNWW